VGQGDERRPVRHRLTDVINDVQAGRSGRPGRFVEPA